jgi:hypothetical protein
VPGFVRNASQIFTELAQNAQRAGATKLDVTLKDGVLTAEDNGRGADRAEPLLVLADSEWDVVVERDQMPAGWGLFSLYSLCEHVTFTSIFGTLHLDCKRFLDDEHYRDTVLDRVNAEKRRKGFRIEAVLRKCAAEKNLDHVSFYGMERQLGHFPMEVTFNGQAVKRLAANPYGNDALKLVYLGNDLYVNLKLNFPQTADEFKGRLRVIWYGIGIGHEPDYSIAVLNVMQGTPVSPVLPYRTDVKSDEKLAELYDFIRKKVVEYCIRWINNMKNGDEKKLVNLMDIMSSIGLQDELNRLDRFYYRTVEPYHEEEPSRFYGAATSSRIIVKRGDPVPCSENVNLAIRREESDRSRDAQGEDTDDLVLPAGAIVEIHANPKKPDWLVIQEREMVIHVTTKKQHDGFFTWRDSDITCEGKNIPCLGLVRGYWDGEIYYRGDPRGFDDIEAAVFSMRIYSEDGDTYDTQLDEYRKLCGADVARITGSFSTESLFGEIAQAAGMKTYEIGSVVVKGKTATVTSKRGKMAAFKLY